MKETAPRSSPRADKWILGLWVSVCLKVSMYVCYVSHEGISVYVRVTAGAESWSTPEQPIAGTRFGSGARLHLGPRRNHHHIPLAAHGRLRTALRQG